MCPMEAQAAVRPHNLSARPQLEPTHLPRPGKRGLGRPLNLLGDERLARHVGEGDERAFNVVFARYHQQLYRYCHSMLRHDADAQDALQSTFAAALVALRRSQRDAPLRPWLFRIAHNEAVSLMRRRRPGVELSETLTPPGPSAEETVQDRARLAQLVADLQVLPERQRGALVMRELSGLSHEDVAQALGVSLGAAKQTVFEARKALQEFAEGRAMACEEIQRTLSDGDGRALRGRRMRAHLRECSVCSAFATAIPERRTALLALSPALPAAVASGLLGRVTGSASLHHGGGGGLLTSASGKSLGAVLSAKTLATGVAIVATAAAGTVGAVEIAANVGHPVSRVVPSGDLSRAASATGHNGHAGRANSPLGHAAGAQGHSSGRGSTAPGGAARHGAGPAHSRAGGSVSSSTAGSSKAGSGSATGGGQGSSSTNPDAHGGNPNAAGGNATTGTSNPNAHGGNPNAGGGNANAHGGNPNAGGGNANAHGGNPNADGGNANAHGGNPNAGGANGTTGTSNPNVHGGNPNAEGGNSNAGGGSTNAHAGNPNVGGANAPGGNLHG
jgi:RNA polymerase sigma factor (sigma-70 family)